jgi:hypothetical protein
VLEVKAYVNGTTTAALIRLGLLQQHDYHRIRMSFSAFVYLGFDELHRPIILVMNFSRPCLPAKVCHKVLYKHIIEALDNKFDYGGLDLLRV